jgi:hypothetical protein
MGTFHAAAAPDSKPHTLRKFWFPAYLTFTVCFYAYRFLFGLGASGTIYDSDAPGWLRISKDVVWFCFLLLTLLLGRAEEWDAVRASWKGKQRFLASLAALVLTFMVVGWFHLLFFYQSASDTLLYWYRYPLEYIPIVLVLPILINRWEPFGRLAVFLSSLSILFLAYELFSGRATGFLTRYGSIFGSPNDFGLFCTLMILGLLVCGQSWRHWLLAGLMAIGLLVSMSRSAMVGLVIGLSTLMYLRQVRRGVLVGISFLCLIALLVTWNYPQALQLSEVTFAAEHFGVDESAMVRVDEVNQFEGRFGDLSLSTLLFGTRYFHVESWYLALLIRTGVIGLAAWIAVMYATLRRGWRFRKVSRVHAVAMASVAAISAANTFLPLPDVFPSNFYLWLAVGIVWLPVPKFDCAQADFGN